MVTWMNGSVAGGRIAFSRSAAPTIVSRMVGQRREGLSRGGPGSDDVLDHQHARAGSNWEPSRRLEKQRPRARGKSP
jgi:hypothetical protein